MLQFLQFVSILISLQPGLIEGLLDIQSLGGKEIHHSCLELLLTFAQDSEVNYSSP